MSEKGKCIFAYLLSWLGGLIVLFGMKDNEKNTKIHAAQAIVIGVAYTAIVTIYSILPIYIPFLSTAIWILYLLCVIFGIIKACNDDNPELPVVGSLAQSIFSKKIDE